MLNIKGRKASSNTSSLHVLFHLPCTCDERIFHKIYLTRTEIISGAFVGLVFTALSAVCDAQTV